MLDDHTLTLVLLSVIAPVGAIDALYFHVWKFRLAERRESRLDAASEGDSRKDLGGLPPLEYAIHIAGATWVGAASLAYVVVGLPHATSPTELATATLPGWLVANAVVIGVGAFALAALEAGLMCGAACRPERLGAT